MKKAWKVTDGPFKDCIIVGPHTLKREGRKFFSIRWPPDYKRTAISNARYLMSVKLGRVLDTKEFVHHKDEDPTNDSLDNLEILSPGAHKRHHNILASPCRRRR